VSLLWRGVRRGEHSDLARDAVLDRALEVDDASLPAARRLYEAEEELVVLVVRIVLGLLDDGKEALERLLRVRVSNPAGARLRQLVNSLECGK